MIKVLHVRGTNFYGGPEKQILEHARRGPLIGAEVIVGSFARKGERNELLGRCAESGIRTVQFVDQGPFDPSVAKQLKDYVLREGVSIVCSHGYKAAFCAYMVKSGMKSPHVAFVRGNTADYLKVKLYQAAEERLLRLAQGVVAVSESEADRIRRFLRPDQVVHVVKNAVAIDADGRGGDATPDGFPEVRRGRRFGVIGRLSPEKGHEVLFDAFSCIAASYPDASLMVCGDGPLRRRLERQISSANLSQQVFIAGHRTDMPDVYRWLDFIVIPSFSEGLPNALLEAMAHGKIVVATSVGGIPEVVENGVTGYLVASGDATQLGAAMTQAILSHESGEMGAAARESMQRNCSFDKQTMQLAQVYQEVVHRGVKP